jgi:hypothetical protein
VAAARCPIGNPQILGRALGFWERGECELELRVVLRRDEGICEVIVDERTDDVYVRVLLCYEEKPDDDESSALLGGRCDCPVRVWLDRPLGDRAVIDVNTNNELDLYNPGLP